MTFVEDLELAYSIISGTDFKDSWCTVKPYRSQQGSVDIKKLRIGYFTEYSQVPTTECTKKAIHKVVNMFKEVKKIDTFQVEFLAWK